MTDDEERFVAFLNNKQSTIRDLDLDAFADGVIAHRNGVAFHENPHGTDAGTIQRLSWTLGWNERALTQHQ